MIFRIPSCPNNSSISLIELPRRKTGFDFSVLTSTSPAAPRLLAAIQLFVSNNGRGRRPWENIFGYLRFATVELATTRTETNMEQRRTSGSLTAMSDSACTPYARQAERRRPLRSVGTRARKSVLNVREANHKTCQSTRTSVNTMTQIREFHRSSHAAPHCVEYSPELKSAPSIVHEALRSPGQPLI